MTSFADVGRATCEIVCGDKIFGTGFAVLPDGWVLTCHHVVYGMDAIMVRFPGMADPLPAEYVAEWSQPDRDIAVLHAAGAPPTCVALGRPRTGAKVTGIGFRPKERSTEPGGHSFSATLEPGQQLRLEPPKAAVDRITGASPRPWNVLPGAARTGHVHNFTGSRLLVQGISGGPVYDRGLRRVVAMFRAVEGDAQAYALSVTDAFDAWPDLEEQNRAAAPDGPLDTLARYDIGLVEETGLLPVRSHAREEFSRIFARHDLFGGRSDELGRLDAVLDGEGPFAFVTGPAGFGKTALLANWVRTLERRGVPVAYHFITPGIEAASEEFLLENVCQQLMERHGLGGVLPANARGLRALYGDLLRLPPASAGPLVLVIDGLDEAIGRWEPRNARLFPADPFRRRADRLLGPGDRRPRLALGAPTRASRTAHDPARAALRRRGCRRRIARGRRAVTGTAGSARHALHSVSGRSLLPAGPASTSWAAPRATRRRLRACPSATAPTSSSGGSTGSSARGRTATRSPTSWGPSRWHVRRSRVRSWLPSSPDDALTSTSFDLLMQRAARYVDGSDAAGYELRHSRIRPFVCDRLGDEMAVYRGRLASYCMRWGRPGVSPRARDYMLAHAAEHLVDAGRENELLALLDSDWFEAKWTRYGTYAALVNDLRIATGSALAQEPVDVATALALAVSRETVGELMLDLLRICSSRGRGSARCHACSCCSTRSTSRKGGRLSPSRRSLRHCSKRPVTTRRLPCRPSVSSAGPSR